MDKLNGCYEPTAMDLMEKGDYDEVEPIIIKISGRNTRGRQARRKAEALKIKKVRRMNDHYCMREDGPWVCDKGYIKTRRDSKRQQYGKKLSHKKARCQNRCIGEDAFADIKPNKNFDFWWELY